MELLESDRSLRQIQLSINIYLCKCSYVIVILMTDKNNHLTYPYDELIINETARKETTLNTGSSRTSYIKNDS